MKGAEHAGSRFFDWAMAGTVAIVVAIYVFRHRSLLSELPLLWEALL